MDLTQLNTKEFRYKSLVKWKEYFARPNTMYTIRLTEKVNRFENETHLMKFKKIKTKTHNKDRKKNKQIALNGI